MIVYLSTVTVECHKHRWRAVRNIHDNIRTVCVWRGCGEGVCVEGVWRGCVCGGGVERRCVWRGCVWRGCGEGVCVEGGIKGGGGVRGHVSHYGIAIILHRKPPRLSL